MDLFDKAKMVRLRSHHDKYLVADENKETVSQSRQGSLERAVWTVELVPDSQSHLIRLKSCYGKYLTASHQLFLLGVTGRKVLQTLPKHFDYSHEWQPVRGQGSGHVKLRTREGHFLRANGRLPPWRACVTHDVPFRTTTQDWVLWDVQLVVASQLPSNALIRLPKPNEAYEEAIGELSKMVKTHKHDLKGMAASKIKKLSAELAAAASPHHFDAAERIQSGFLRFKTTMFERNPDYFNKLGEEQHPKFMVFACSDSRVSPTLILNLMPGEAFMVRNMANIVPPYDKSYVKYVEVGACIEYAVGHLKVENILIMGHSRCGGMPDPNTISTNQLLVQMESECCQCEKEAVNVSLENLLTYPYVKAAVKEKRVSLKGAHYDFVNATFQLWNLDVSLFKSHISFS